MDQISHYNYVRLTLHPSLHTDRVMWHALRGRVRRGIPTADMLADGFFDTGTGILTPSQVPEALLRAAQDFAGRE